MENLTVLAVTLAGSTSPVDKRLSSRDAPKFGQRLELCSSAGVCAHGSGLASVFHKERAGDLFLLCAKPKDVGDGLC